MNSIRSLNLKHQNQRGFVLGTGGSISNLLRNRSMCEAFFRSEIVVGCKQIHREFDLSYWVCMDPAFLERESHALQGKKFVGFVPELNGSDKENRETEHFITVPASKGASGTNRCLSDFSQLRNDADTGVIALRIAHLLGLNPIYIIGLNDKIFEGRLHYHQESKRVISHETALEMGQDLKSLVEHIQRDGVTIVSCSPISLLNSMVPYRDIQDLIREG